jgi:hypothetical protein
MLPPRLFVYVAVHRNETQAFEKYSESYRNMQHGNRLPAKPCAIINHLCGMN